MHNYASITKADGEKLKKQFYKTLGICKDIFGDSVFKDTTKSRLKQSIVHYDLLMNSFSAIPKSKVKGKEDKIIKAFESLCKNPAFQTTLSGGIQNKTSILKRRELWSLKLKPILGK